MPLTPAQLTTLGAYINSDPDTYGFAADVTAGNDQAITDKLNKTRDGTDGETAVNVPRENLTQAQLLEAIDVRDIPAGTVGQSAYLNALLMQPNLRMRNANDTATLVKSNLDRIVGATNGSQARLDALGRRPGSRAEQLFGVGVRVSIADVGAALGRPA